MREDVCYKTIAKMAAERIADTKHKGQPYHDGEFKRWSKEFSADTPNLHTDGVTIWVSESPAPTAGR